MTRAYYEQCKGCHFANYTKTLDGVHYAVMAKGNDKAALCVDCHGAHDISRPGQPRTRISQMCRGCHAKEADIYAQERPRPRRRVEQRRRAGLHRLPPRARHRRPARRRAGDAHAGDLRPLPHRREADEEVRALDEGGGDLPRRLPRHGRHAAAGQDEGAGRRLAAVCTDCHGVHDIQKADDPTLDGDAGEPQKTCAKCHAGASESFPKAWLSHYEPTLEKAPLVWR